MQGLYHNIGIKGIACAVPKNELDNIKYAAEQGGRKLKKQIQLTGIESRRACINGQTASDLCTVAAEKLLEKLNWNRDSIKALIYVTQSAEYQRPSTAFLIQKRLGIGQECIVFDMNMGCTGFLAGLQVIAGLLHNSGGRGLLLAGESNTLKEGKGFNPSYLLEGDAGCAAAIETEAGHQYTFKHWSDGSRFHYIYKPLSGSPHMDGNSVLLFSLNDVVSAIKEFKSIFDIKEEEIDYYILHQAQKLIIDGVASNAEIPLDKMLYSCKKYGNTSSASIPVTLCANLDTIKKKEIYKLFCCGFGIGLSWSTAFIDISESGILPIMETEQHFDDWEQKNG